MSSPGWTRSFSEWAEGFVHERGIPGLSVAVAENGTEIFAQGFGYADREAGAPITPDTIYGIGSCTKSFTCAAVMHLHEQGRLDIDAPVTRYLPELGAIWGDRAHAMKLYHFMTHTAGLPPLPVLQPALRDSMLEDPDAREELDAYEPLGLGSIATTAEHVGLLGRLPFPWLGEPGAFFSYSNDCHGLLGPVIERVSGVPYERYLEQVLLAPLGMTRSLFEADRLAAIGDVATIYSRRPVKGTDGEPLMDGDKPRTEVFRSPAWWSAPSQTAAGWLKCSARDMLRYLELYNVGGAGVISPESVARMTAPFISVSPVAGAGYGFGLNMTVHHGVKLVTHSGGLKGISAYMIAIPERHMAITALMAVGDEPSHRPAMAVVNAILGLDLETASVEPVSTPLARQAGDYAGKYYSGESVHDIEVVAENGELFLVADGKRDALTGAQQGYLVAGEPAERAWILPAERDGKVFGLRVGSRTWPRRELWDEAGYPKLRGWADLVR